MVEEVEEMDDDVVDVDADDGSSNNTSVWMTFMIVCILILNAWSLVIAYSVLGKYKG